MPRKQTKPVEQTQPVSTSQQEMVTLRVVKRFRDVTSGIVRNIGDIFEATEERSIDLAQNSAGPFVEVVEPLRTDEEETKEEIEEVIENT